MPTVSSTAQVSWEYLLMAKAKRYVRCAGYPRNSDPSKKDSATLESQEKEIQRFIKSRENEGYVFEEGCMYPEAMTAYMLPYRDRPQLMKLLDDARRKKFDVLVVTEYSRLSRRQSEQAVLISILEDMGVRVESVTEQFDDSALGQFMRAAAAFSGESEREKTFWRTRRGEKDRAEVALPGGGKPTYGYKFVDGEKYKRARFVPNEDIIWVDENGKEWSEAEVVRFIFAKLKLGRSIRQTRLELTRLKVPTRKGGYVWADATVHYIATRERYVGRAINNTYGAKNRKVYRKPEEEHIVLDTTGAIIPPLVDLDTWKSVQERLAENKQLSLRRNTQKEYGMLRGGLVRCAVCGWSMVARSRKARPESPITQQYFCCRKDGGEEKRCNHVVAILLPVADQYVWDVVVSYLRKPEQVRNGILALRKELTIESHRDAIEKQIEEITKRKDNILKMAEIAMDADSIATLQKRLSELERERRELYTMLVDEEEREEVNKKIMEEVDRFERWVMQVTPRLSDPQCANDILLEEKRLACRVLGIKVYIHPASVPDRIEVQVSPPAIMKEMKPLLRLAHEDATVSSTVAHSVSTPVTLMTGIRETG